MYIGICIYWEIVLFLISMETRDKKKEPTEYISVIAIYLSTCTKLQDTNLANLNWN